MIPFGLVFFRPLGTPTVFGTPGCFLRCDIRVSSRYTLTSDSCFMKVIEDARKRVRSKAFGIGAGSLRVISNVVQGSFMSSVLGSLPRLTNN